MAEELQSDPIQTVTCENCKQEVDHENVFCPSCGYPVKGTDQQRYAYSVQLSRRKSMLGDAEKRIKEARTAIFVVAGLTFIGGLFVGISKDNSAAMVVNFILTILYLIFAAWCTKNPFGAILTAFIVYVTTIILNAIVEPATLISGIIVKILVVIALIKGIQSALEAKRLMQELQSSKTIL
jgi:hypothetical protein